jgi:hypothetical protein
LNHEPALGIDFATHPGKPLRRPIFRPSQGYHRSLMKMDTSPLSRQLSLRLDQLTREIHRSLEEVRRYIQELEEVEQSAHLGQTQTGQDFTQLLKNTLDRPGPSSRRS